MTTQSARRRLGRLLAVAATLLSAAVPAGTATAAGSDGAVVWSDSVDGVTTGTGFVFGSNCTSARTPNAAEEASTLPLMNSWAAGAAGAGNTFLSVGATPPAGVSGDGATLTFPQIPDLTVTVSRRQVTPASALDDSDPSTGAASANAAFSAAGRLQDCAPRPADLTAAPAGMTLAAPASLSGLTATPATFWNATTFPAGNQLDGALFEFSRPVGSFGLWFGDLETRFPDPVSGGGVLARIKLLDSGGNVIEAADITPDETVTDDTVCGGPDLATDLVGCGNQASRFIGFNRPARDVAAMLVIVGDDDSCAQAGECDGITEYLSWIGPLVAEPQPDLTVTKTVRAPGPAAPGDPITYDLVVTNAGPGPAAAGWTVTDVPPAAGVSGLTLTGNPAEVTCAALTCTGLGPLAAGATVNLSATGTWAASPGQPATNRAHVLPVDGDVPEIVPADPTPPDTSTDTDSTPTNNDTQAPYVIPAVPGITIDKTVETAAGAGVFDETGIYAAGQPVTFTITVTNTGNVDLTDVTVTDPAAPACGQVIGDLAAGATVTYTCTAADGYTADTTNTAAVTGQPPTGPPVVDDDPADIDIINPGIAIDKTVETAAGTGTFDETGIYRPGQRVRWRITVTNTGDADLTDVTVTDPAAPGCDRTIGTLTAGASVTYTCATPGGYGNDTTNTATVTGTPPAGPDATDTDTAAVIIETPGPSPEPPPPSQLPAGVPLARTGGPLLVTALAGLALVGAGGLLRLSARSRRLS